MLLTKRIRSKMSRQQLNFLRAFNELMPEQRFNLNFLIAELMMRSSPELLENRRKAVRDPSIPLLRPSWKLRLRKTRRGRQLEIIECIERVTTQW